MTAKTSQTHGLGDHVLRDAASAPGNTDGVNPDSCDAIGTHADATGHGWQTSQPDCETGTFRESECSLSRNADVDERQAHVSAWYIDICGYGSWEYVGTAAEAELMRAEKCRAAGAPGSVTWAGNVDAEWAQHYCAHGPFLVDDWRAGKRALAALTGAQ